ncbi:MAG: hypothetical protein JXR76_28650 [Deltaproteobacteria bacterium]|nr:hypothetical protein [Deltaproteobacteria bacterium]
MHEDQICTGEIRCCENATVPGDDNDTDTGSDATISDTDAGTDTDTKLQAAQQKAISSQLRCNHFLKIPVRVRVEEATSKPAAHWTGT